MATSIGGAASSLFHSRSWGSVPATRWPCWRATLPPLSCHRLPSASSVPMCCMSTLASPGRSSVRCCAPRTWPRLLPTMSLPGCSTRSRGGCLGSRPGWKTATRRQEASPACCAWPGPSRCRHCHRRDTRVGTSSSPAAPPASPRVRPAARPKWSRARSRASPCLTRFRIAPAAPRSLRRRRFTPGGSAT